MKRSKHTSKLAGLVSEHSHGEYSAVNRYEGEFHHGGIRRKLSDGKAGSSVGGSSKNLKEGSSGVSHLSKGVLREGGRLRVAKTTAVMASPLLTGTIVGAIAVGFYGVANILRYKRHEKSGVRAAKDTIAGSAGVGISTGLGVAVANAVVGTLGSMVLVPVAAGAAAAYLSMAVWDKLFYTGKVATKTR